MKNYSITLVAVVCTLAGIALGMFMCTGDDEPATDRGPATTLDLEDVFGPRPTRPPTTTGTGTVYCRAIEPPPGQEDPSYICEAP